MTDQNPSGPPIGRRQPLPHPAQPPQTPQQAPPQPYQPDPTAHQWQQQYPPGYYQQGWGRPQQAQPPRQAQQAQPYRRQPPPPPRPPKRRGRILGIVVGVFVGAMLAFGACVALLGGAANQAKKELDKTVTSAVPAAATPPADAPASAPTSPQQDRPANGAVGERVTVADGNGDVLGYVAVTQVRAATVSPGQFGTKPDHGLYLAVTVAARGETSLDLNPINFYVKGPDGTHYEQTIALGFGPDLRLATLHQGERTSGVIVFDVKPDARHGQIAYAPNYQGPAIATWRY